MKPMMRKNRLGDARPHIVPGTAINVPQGTRNRLKLYCAVNNLSMCRVVEALIEDYLDYGGRFKNAIDGLKLKTNEVAP